MPKVLCTLPHASELINGVRFVSHALGMLSEEVAHDVADAFLEVPGFKAHAVAAVKEEVDPEIAALQARAAELLIKVDARWKSSRLKTEIAAAEKAVADALAGGTKTGETAGVAGSESGGDAGFTSTNESTPPAGADNATGT